MPEKYSSTPVLCYRKSAAYLLCNVLESLDIFKVGYVTTSVPISRRGPI